MPPPHPKRGNCQPGGRLLCRYGERMRILWALLRIVFSLAILAAIVFQLAATLGKAADGGRSVPLTALNFFSYFTIDSNSLAVVTLAIGAILLLARKGE